MALGAPGQGLPYPQSLYPSNLLNGTFIPPSNCMTLAAGDAIPVPRGDYWVDPGLYGSVQFLDPITQTWRTISSARAPGGMAVSSDGFNWRVANLTGCAVAAVVTTAGTGYVQASTTVTPSAGNSVWRPIIGGLINTTVTIGTAGAGYGVPPLVVFGPPPPGGVPASGYATISAGAVASIVVTNQGAGYLAAPPITLITSPFDPNFLAGSAITQAVATCALTGAGTLAAILCTNSGAPFAVGSVPTLAIAGAGASAAATVVQLQTLTGATINGGVAYNTSAYLTTVGGIPSVTPAYTNPRVEMTAFVPRPATGLIGLSGGVVTTVTSLLDAGMFAGTPVGSIPQGGAAPTTATTVTLALGNQPATITMQPLG